MMNKFFCLLIRSKLTILLTMNIHWRKSLYPPSVICIFSCHISGYVFGFLWKMRKLSFAISTHFSEEVRPNSRTNSRALSKGRYFLLNGAIVYVPNQFHIRSNRGLCKLTRRIWNILRFGFVLEVHSLHTLTTP